ncbi:MAG TPA: hypothetical protein VJ256_07345, partial [Dehalococcoidia bacterium]|nr:hypothetical protein [Dehalococcoidia bacterium]
EPNAVFLTNPTLYAGPELAGRRLYVGFDLFVVNVGYDAGARIEMARAIYRSPSKTEACRLLAEQGIDYVQIGPDEVRALEISTDLFAQEFTAAYREPTPLGEVALYSVEESCRGYGGPSSGA